MTTYMSGLLKAILPLLLVAGLAACSKRNEAQILGHWRANHLKIQSLSIPMGPDFIINKHELVSLDGAVRIPISSITVEDEVVTVSVPAGIGLSFHFEGADRMYFQLPFLDKVYFQRVSDTSASTSVKPIPAPEPQEKAAITSPTIIPVVPANDRVVASQGNVTRQAGAALGSAVDLVRRAEQEMNENHLGEAEALLMQAQRQYANDPIVDYNLAIFEIRQGDKDASIRHLSQAFQHGFRAFSLLDASQDLSPLKADVRYGALLARYR